MIAGLLAAIRLRTKFQDFETVTGTAAVDSSSSLNFHFADPTFSSLVIGETDESIMLMGSILYPDHAKLVGAHAGGDDPTMRSSSCWRDGTNSSLRLSMVVSALAQLLQRTGERLRQLDCDCGGGPEWQAASVAIIM